jgi:hypothetical protein
MDEIQHPTHYVVSRSILLLHELSHGLENANENAQIKFIQFMRNHQRVLSQQLDLNFAAVSPEYSFQLFFMSKVH